MVIAGIFSLFPAPAMKTFGFKYGPQVYSIILLGSPLSAIVDTFFIKFLYKVVGEFPILCFGSFMSLAALITCCFFDEKLDLAEMEEKGLIVWVEDEKEESNK